MTATITHQEGQLSVRLFQIAIAALAFLSMEHAMAQERSRPKCPETLMHNG
jgi:hypothetical protein